ncbi:MAG: hypothetical protein WDA59_00525 [Methanofastidiosum sp.]|nr:hypothetical protein [Candidatus Izemoplasmatales bacterium]
MIQYKLKVKNDLEERIVRRKNIFWPESVREVITDEMGFKEIKACRPLKIEKLTIICPICQKEFRNKHGFLTHIIKTHPEEKYKILGKKG